MRHSINSLYNHSLTRRDTLCSRYGEWVQHNLVNKNILGSLKILAPLINRAWLICGDYNASPFNIK